LEDSVFVVLVALPLSLFEFNLAFQVVFVHSLPPPEAGLQQPCDQHCTQYEHIDPEEVHIVAATGLILVGWVQLVAVLAAQPGSQHSAGLFQEHLPAQAVADLVAQPGGAAVVVGASTRGGDS